MLRLDAAGGIIEAPHSPVHIVCSWSLSVLLLLFNCLLTISVLPVFDQLFYIECCSCCNLYAFLFLDLSFRSNLRQISNNIKKLKLTERTRAVLYRDVSYILLLYDAKLICTDVKQSTRNVEYWVGINRYSWMQLAALAGTEYIILAFITQKGNYSAGFTFLRCSYSWCPLAYQCKTWLKQHW